MPDTCEKRKYSLNSDDSLRERARRYAAVSARKTGNLHKYYFATRRALLIPFRHRSEVQGQDLARSFREQVNLWKDQTGHLSSVRKAIAHPAYLRIIGLAKYSTGHEIERLLLQELESEPDHWFAALNAVTGEDPVTREHDFDESVNAWLAWGRKKRII
jgi:hypothetical protein